MLLIRIPREEIYMVEIGIKTEVSKNAQLYKNSTKFYLLQFGFLPLFRNFKIKLQTFIFIEDGVKIYSHSSTFNMKKFIAVHSNIIKMR